MRGIRRIPLVAVAALFATAMPALAQQADRTIDEIKSEALARAERGAYPLGGLDLGDVREALGKITTRDPDEWAAAWSAVGDRYVERAKGDPAQADASYLRAWRLYYFGQWPAPTSRGKEAAYRKAVDAYLARAKSFDPPLEVVRIPFEGSEIVGYFRHPKQPGPAPVVIGIAGLDSRKENVAETYAALVPRGVAFFAVDSPGTGQAPVRAGPDADRIYSRIIDTLAARPDVDKTRILVHGQSFGAYWAAKLAFTERDRLRGVVAQSPGVDAYFDPAALRGSIYTREYLFDRAPAYLHVYGKPSLEQFFTDLPAMSLKAQGLLGKPSAPLFVVGGVKDTQVPISDLDLLIHSGTEPREAWINPVGGHMGREAKGWTDPVIFREVIVPWLLRRAGAERAGG